MAIRNPHLDERRREFYGGTDPREGFIAKSNRRRWSPREEFGQHGEFSGSRREEVLPSPNMPGSYRGGDEGWGNYPAGEFAGITSPGLLRGRDTPLKPLGIPEEETYWEGQKRLEETRSQRAARIWKAHEDYNKAQMLMNEPEARALEAEVAGDFGGNIRSFTPHLSQGFEPGQGGKYGWPGNWPGTPLGLGKEPEWNYGVEPGSIFGDLTKRGMFQDAKTMAGDLSGAVDMMGKPNLPAEMYEGYEPILGDWMNARKMRQAQPPSGAVDMMGRPVDRPERPRWDNWLGNFIRSIAGRNRGGLASLKYAR